MFGSSLKAGGKFASDVVGAVATGNISSVGTITGDKAAQALTSYLGYGVADDSAAGNEHGAGTVSPGTQIPVTPDHDMSQSQEGVTITQDGRQRRDGRERRRAHRAEQLIELLHRFFI